MGIANISAIKLKEDEMLSYCNLISNHLDFLAYTINEKKEDKSKLYAANQVSLLINSLSIKVDNYIKMLNGEENGAN